MLCYISLPAWPRELQMSLTELNIHGTDGVLYTPETANR